MSDQRSARSSPLRQPVAASTSRYVRMHQGPEADSNTMSCWDGVRAIARCFLTRGSSLLVTGFVDINPHRIARANALETTPAIQQTVLADRGRSSFVPRRWPPVLRRDR